MLIAVPAETDPGKGRVAQRMLGQRADTKSKLLAGA